MDYTTINLAALKKLPTYTLPRTYMLQRDPGNGCYLDAPGYPTYFTRSVHTMHGNSPSYGPQTVIQCEGRNYITESADDWQGVAHWDEKQAKVHARLRSLWKPLPFAHKRVRIWLEHVYQHLAHCYQDAERPENGKSGMLIYPVPDYKLKSFADAPHCIAADEIARATRIAVPENHQAYVHVHEFYPEHQPDLALIANPPKLSQADWWTTSASKPTPETCKPRWGQHPVDAVVQYCHWCGEQGGKV